MKNRKTNTEKQRKRSEINRAKCTQKTKINGENY